MGEGSGTFNIFRVLHAFIVMGNNVLVFHTGNLGETLGVFMSIFANFSLGSVIPNDKGNLNVSTGSCIVVTVNIIIVFVINVVGRGNVSIHRGITGLPFPIGFILCVTTVLIVVVFNTCNRRCNIRSLVCTGF